MEGFLDEEEFEPPKVKLKPDSDSSAYYEYSSDIFA